MAATDQTYRSQRLLDITFSVSSILMLFSIGWMFVQDYNREYKVEQRAFRDVEAEMAMRTALEQIPELADVEAVEARVEAARAQLKDWTKRDDDVARRLRIKFGKSQPASTEEAITRLKAEIQELQPKKEKADAHFQDIKSLLESRMSFYNIAKDQKKEKLSERYAEEIERLNKELAVAQADKDKFTAELRVLQNDVVKLDAPLSDALLELKKLNDKFDSQMRLALKKQWAWWPDSFLAWPIIDGFASPFKIHQFTINDVPIDYNFKYVTRFDRCMTCHQGIDRPTYTRERVASLRENIPESLSQKVKDARKMLEKRRK